MEVLCALSNGDISNNIDRPLTRFQGHSIFEVEYLKNMHLTDKVTIEHVETIDGGSIRVGSNDLE